MTTLAELRRKFPQYDALSDGDFLIGLNRKLYPNVNPHKFLGAIDGAANAQITIKNPDIRKWYEEQVVKPMDGETPEQTAVRIGGSAQGPVGDPGGPVWSAARGALQGMTLGAGDEIVAAGTAALSDQTYDQALKAERDRLALGREQNPVASYGSELAGAVAVPTPSTVGSLAQRAAQAAGIGGLLGSIYGFNSGEGTSDRLSNAAYSGILSGAVSGAIPVVGGVLSNAISKRAGQKAIDATVKSAPTSGALKADAGALYDAARANGVTASTAETGRLAATMNGIARSEGLVTPTGRVADNYPAVRHALNMADDYAQGTMNPTQMQEVKRAIDAVAGSSDANEARIGVKMMNAYKAFVNPLAPEFRQADALYSRAMKGDMIDQAMERASIRAGQFSGSGYENALRTEFRQLAMKISKGEIKGLSKEQIAAINRVAKGGIAENILRDIGKAAPRGVVGTGISTGVPFAIGNAVGGPGLGGIFAAATLGAGEIGRRAATAMQTANANYAGGLMRAAAPAAVPPTAGKVPVGLLEQVLTGVIPSLSAQYMQTAR